MSNILISDLLKPFNCLEHLLTAVHILNKYSSYQVVTQNELINKVTGFDITCSEITLLKKRIETFPEMFGLNYFIKNKELQEKIDIHLNELNNIQFATKKARCIFCNSSLEMNIKKSLSVCYFFASEAKQSTINIFKIQT